MNIVPYGEEPAMEKSKVFKLLKQWIPSESIPNYVRLKHFTADSAKNVRMTNVRSNMLQVFKHENGQTQWLHMDKKNMLNEIVLNGLDDLIEFGATNIISWNSWYLRTGLNEHGYDKKPEWKTLMNKVEKIIINSRDVGKCQSILSFARPDDLIEKNVVL